MTFELIEVTILTLINAFSIFLIIIFLANSAKERLYQCFVLMTISLLGWVNFAYLGYSEKDTELALNFYRLNWAFVSVFLFTAYLFYIEYFLKINKKVFKWVFITIGVIFVFLSLFTDTIIQSITHKDWGNEITFGPIDPLFSLFAFSLPCVLIYYFISKYFTLIPREKKKVLYFLIGTILFVLFNVVFNILSPIILDTARYQHFGDYSAVIFLAFTAFAIVRRKFLNIKVALAAFLISIIGVLLLVDIIALSHTSSEQGVKIVMFIGFVGISIVLVRSVLNEIKQREQLAKVNVELAESRAIIQRKAEEQKDIIDVMGHEIRTPLSVIRQELNYHRETTFVDEKEWKAGKATKEEITELFKTVHTIDEEVDHTLRLVTDMLETARIEKQRFELNISEFDIVELARKTFEIVAKTEDAKTFDMKYEDSALGKLLIKADETRVRESIDALLNNAIKYGKNIYGKESKILMKVSKDNNNVYISFKDNGRGIDKEDIKKLGKKFVRLQPKTINLARPGGTGLGLFVVKNIMKHHKGDLIIESDGIGKGSTFTMQIPLTTPNNLNK